MAAKKPDSLLPGTEKQLADILLRYWHGGRDEALDINVVNTLHVTLLARVAQVH